MVVVAVTRPRTVAEPAPAPRVERFHAGDPALSLAPAQREAFSESAEASIKVWRLNQFFLWAQGELQRVLPHQILIIGHGSGSAGMQFRKFASTRYFTDQHFDQVCRAEDGLVVRMMRRWHRGATPCLLSPEMRSWECDEAWLEEARRHEMNNAACHGVRTADGRIASFFCLSRIGLRFDAQLYQLLWLVVPHLHETLMRVLIEEGRVTTRSVRTDCSVTDREAEILRWVRDGKTNRDIADILDVSPYTVKNHIQKVLRKMGVENRSHAVARAISLGILNSSEG